jgi:hypothetical protein
MQNTLYSGPSTQPNIVVQPMNSSAYNDDFTVKFKPQYLSSPSGILRLALTVCHIIYFNRLNFR